jgi:hypothetical protein
MVRIARWRSYTSVLVIPRRKMSLCEALHGRCSWPELKLHGSSWGARRRGEEGGRGRGAGGTAWGRHGERKGCRRGTMGARPCCSFGSVRAAVREFLYMREGRKEEGEREKKRKEKEGKEKRKKKKYGNFSKLEIFWEEK